MERAAIIRLTASGIALTGEGTLIAVVLAAGSDTATVILDDSTDGTGTALVELTAVLNTNAQFVPGVKINVKTGIYATIAGTAPSVSVVFTP